MQPSWRWSLGKPTLSSPFATGTRFQSIVEAPPKGLLTFAARQGRYWIEGGTEVGGSLLQGHSLELDAYLTKLSAVCSD